MSAAFLKWYLAALKSHPFAANMSTAVVLMSAGDAMAQGIEYSQSSRSMEHVVTEEVQVPTLSLQAKPLAISAAVHNKNTTASSRHSFTLNRHATLSPHLEVAHCDYGISRLEWESPTNNIDLVHDWHDLTLPNLDSVRTGTMALWAGAIQAPFFLVLYRFYDRILPTAITPYAVGSRVALSFVSTVPFTAAFFGYGTLIHHWLNHGDDQQGSTDNNKEEPDSSFWTTVADKIQQKWSQDLPSTLQTSAAVWVPFNTLNFSLVPPHLRPLSMMVMSASWNCYLP